MKNMSGRPKGEKPCQRWVNKGCFRSNWTVMQDWKVNALQSVTSTIQDDSSVKWHHVWRLMFSLLFGTLLRTNKLMSWKVFRNDTEAIRILKRKVWIVGERYLSEIRRTIRKDHFFKWWHLRSVQPLAQVAWSDIVAGVQSDVRQSLIAEFWRRPWKKPPPVTPIAQYLVKKAWFPWTVTWKYTDQPRITRKVARDVAVRIWKEWIPAINLYSWTAIRIKWILNRLFIKS